MRNTRTDQQPQNDNDAGPSGRTERHIGVEVVRGEDSFGWDWAPVVPSARSSALRSARTA